MPKAWQLTLHALEKRFFLKRDKVDAAVVVLLFQLAELAKAAVHRLLVKSFNEKRAVLRAVTNIGITCVAGTSQF